MSIEEPAALSRRSVIKGAATVAAVAATSAGAATAASQVASATTGSTICTGLSLVATSDYDPPITPTVGTYSLHAQSLFTPALTTTNPLLALVRSQVNGNCTAACLGPVTDFTLNGTLHWSDGTTSAWHVDTVTTEVVEGHSVGRNTGIISSGHFAGAQVTRLLLRLSDQLTACLTGGGISSARGAEIIIVTQP